MDISVVIVNYNVKDYLYQCLKSIQHSTKSLNVEVIVVDNNSTDDSVEFLEPLFPEYLFLKLPDNLGFASANNIGIEKSKGKYVLILNPDTILEDNTLDVMFKYMEEHNEVGIAGCKVLNQDGSFQLACRRGFPTPWTSFTKLFGLQTLFPKSRLFARYNQTFRSIDETYYIDSIVGAFMFARKDVLSAVGGFDTDFFMYGEDIDLCYRITQAGWKVAYVHSTSIIHFKGQSTKRSSINDIKHFYNAMEIYVKKHYNHSRFFLFLLRLSIIFRSFFAYINKNRRDIFLILLDLIFVNLSLLLSTKIRFGEFFSFPSYAYPTIFIVVSIVFLSSMFAVGQYFEGEPTIRKSFFGSMISFFILSSLTYFFKEYAFSRGVLLMTIVLTLFLTSLNQIIISLIRKSFGKERDKKIAIIGTNEQTKKIIKAIQNSEALNAILVGIINVEKIYDKYMYGLPILGNFSYLRTIIEDNELDEIIITDNTIKETDLIKLVSDYNIHKVNFHKASEYGELLSSRIISQVSGISTINLLNISKLRYKIAKRLIDIVISSLFFTIGFLPFMFFSKNKIQKIRNFAKIFIGKLTLVGLYPTEEKSQFCKNGILGLAHLSKVETLTKDAIISLNNYYIEHFSLSLDIDIILKSIFRKNSGSKIYT